MRPKPLRPLARLLGALSSRDAANAAIGDWLEELGERRASGRLPRVPALWLNLQLCRAILLHALDAGPRTLRSARLILRDALRAIRAAPVHSLVVVLVLAVGITLGTVTFSVVDAVLFRPLPVEHSERIILIPTRDDAFTQRVNQPMYWRLRDELTSVESLAARMAVSGVMVTVDGRSDQVTVTHADANVFRILRLSPGLGRLWTTEDEVEGRTDVAVLSYGFWRDELGSDPSILGRTLTIGTSRHTVIGVLSLESDHPELDLATPVFVPWIVPRTASDSFLGIIARMRPGVTPAQVAGQLRGIAGAPDWQPAITRYLDSYTTRVRRWLLLALAAAALVVLVACANAANLMLTRSVSRTQEMAIRASLGASRRWIAWSLVAEGLLLSAAATAIALGISTAGVRLAKIALTTPPLAVVRGSTIALDGRVFGAALACAVVVGILCSLVPAWQTSRAPAATLLKDSDARTTTGRRRWRSAFLVAEVATVVVLLVVSWLFVASLVRVVRIDLGMDRTNLLAVSPRLSYRSTVDEVERVVRSIPGVSGVAVSRGTSLPLFGRAYGGAYRDMALAVAGEGGTSNRQPAAVYEYRVTRNYFDVARLQFRQGRTWVSDATTDPVVVLDERAARELFPDGDPIGRGVRGWKPRDGKPAGVFTVIGIVPHVYPLGPEDQDVPAAYFPLAPDPARTFASLLVRTSRPPAAMLPVITEALAPIGPDLEEPFVFAADDALLRITAQRRFLAALMFVFGLVGTLIGAAGVYAVMAAFVAHQARELGIRLALGATPARLRRGVLALAGRHLIAGLVIGVPVAWSTSRGFAALLFQVTPADISVYVGVAMLLGIMGLLSAWLPARRASTIDPIASLRR